MTVAFLKFFVYQPVAAYVGVRPLRQHAQPGRERIPLERAPSVAFRFKIEDRELRVFLAGDKCQTMFTVDKKSVALTATR